MIMANIVIIYACIFTVLSIGNFIRGCYDKKDRFLRIKISVFFALHAAICAKASTCCGLGATEVITVLSFCAMCFLLLAFVSIAAANAGRNSYGNSHRSP